MQNWKVCNYLQLSLPTHLLSQYYLFSWATVFQHMKILKIHTHTLISNPGFSQKAKAASGSLELVTLFSWIDGEGCNYLQWDCVSWDRVSCISVSWTCGTHAEAASSYWGGTIASQVVFATAEDFKMSGGSKGHVTTKQPWLDLRTGKWLHSRPPLFKWKLFFFF